MLIFRKGIWTEHVPWILATVGGSIAAILWYVSESLRLGHLAEGGSTPGLVFALVGLLIVLFEMFLFPRKHWMRVAKIGRAKFWMKAHIWLGFLAAVLFVLHSGFRWHEGALNTALMYSFLLVTLSGIWGLYVQHSIPKAMLDEVPLETIYSQIGSVLRQMHAEAKLLVDIVCGRDFQEGLAPAAVAANVGEYQWKFNEVRDSARFVPGSDSLGKFFDQSVSRYLLEPRGFRSPLATARYAKQQFREMRTKLAPEVHPVVDLLADYCEHRRQFDRQAELHERLHGWLLFHLPLSSIMFVLMLLHMYYALMYI